MILKDIFNIFTKAGKTVTKSTKGTLKFMDDILEKEYIVGAIDDVKEATGKVIEKSGVLYEQAKHSLEGVNVEEVSEKMKEKVMEMKDDLEEKTATIRKDLEEKADEIREDLIRRSEEE